MCATVPQLNCEQGGEKRKMSHYFLATLDLGTRKIKCVLRGNKQELLLDVN